MMGDVAPPTDTLQPILGRDRELAALADLIGLGGSEPRSRSVLLAGDAGVGKTRLLRELVTRARDSGWRTLVGHCLDFGDSALPYLPFSEVFGRLALEAPAKGSASYIIAAADTVMNRSSAGLLEEVFPGVPLTRDVGEFGSLLATGRAREALGFVPQHSWRDYLAAS